MWTNETRYPIYVISKGRSANVLTSRALDRLGVPHRVVVEPQESDLYRQAVGAGRLIVTPFSNLGQGSIPVRNFVKDLSTLEGHRRHWLLDDNIEDFNRLNRNTKYPVRTGATFRASEDFTDRFTNVPLSGMNYYSFCKATDAVPPFYLNTRIYSCLLIENKAPYRWRGKYNEDTDLSLRILKDGLCTILFNAFLCGKVTTMRMGGGNTGEVYGDTDNRREFAESLQKQHPDCVKVVWKFKRWHHQVDYKPFRGNVPILRDDLQTFAGVDNYGMTVKNVGITPSKYAPFSL